MRWRVALQYQSVQAVAWLVTLQVVASVLLALTGLLWAPLALLALWPLATLATWRRAVRADAEHVDPRLWLRRAQQPQLFALIDEATAQMGLAPFDEVEVLPAANAFASHRQGRHVVGLGMPLLATMLRWELLTIVGHELGHVHGEDVLHPQWRAWHALKVLSRLPHPLRATANAAAEACLEELLLTSQEHEHRADAWGGFVAGRGAVERSLRTLRSVDVLWLKLLHDLGVLARHGYIVDNAFTLLRRAWDDPLAARGLHAAARELEAERGGSTHPAFRYRAEHAERELGRLEHRPPPRDACARELIAEAEGVERGWTRFLPGALFDLPAERLRVLDDVSAAVQANLLRGEEARAAIAARAGEAARELPFAGHLQLVHDAMTKNRSQEWLVPIAIGRAERIVKLQHFCCTKDEAADWIAWLLYDAVQRGLLPGRTALAVRGVLVLEGTEHLIGELAEALVERRGPWDVLLRAARGAEERARTVPSPVVSRRASSARGRAARARRASRRGAARRAR
ncbi:MAG: M48 family metallopeptidase [Deltaproteobacteria bacterium]|nr:M48 family metallopeptidase [Deltaproteobacteria bacterium]